MEGRVNFLRTRGNHDTEITFSVDITCEESP